jgi:phosphate transport system ATP-binding protein
MMRFFRVMKMEDNTKFKIENLNVYWSESYVLKSISMDVSANKILGIIGPSGSGKTVFLRTLNRLNDMEKEIRTEGRVLLDGKDIYDSGMNPVELRKKIGMVFALPIPLPASIYNNIIYGPSLSGIRDRDKLDEIVVKSLKSAFLWDEVKDRLKTSAMRLSGGQQQRLCLARTLAMEPEVILLDEPCSGLDPISTTQIEYALIELKKNYTIVLVTNNTKQAARVADNTAFFLMHELVEYGPTDAIFTIPKDNRTLDYITGRFG